MSRRVVVTGMSGVTAFGNDWSTVEPKLRDCQNATQYMPSYEQYDGLNTKLAAPVTDFELPPKHYKRKQVRGMGRVSKLATVATENALSQAGLIGNDVLTNGQTGIAYGSSTGSTDAIGAFGVMLNDKTTKAITATTYVQMMPHTTAVNVGLFFGLKGRVIPTSSACTSGSQAIGYAYEAIKHGYQTVMVAGGAEELCPTESAVFDTLFATSLKNDAPKSTPRPYDTEPRDGLVIGEGAGTLVLEEYEHAVARGAKIYAEIIGFASNCDAAHVTQPQMETMQICMEMALQNAGISADQIDYVSAHGTATDRGDIAESNATANALGKVPISSLKSYFGHTLGACGAIEAWLSLEMMHGGWFNPTLNLENLDPQCGDLDYISGQGRELNVEYLMSNNLCVWRYQHLTHL